MEIQDYEGDEYDDDEMNLNKKGMAAEIMEKLLQMYYNEWTTDSEKDWLKKSIVLQTQS